MLFGEDVAFGGVFRSPDLSMLGATLLRPCWWEGLSVLGIHHDPSIFRHDFAVNGQLACADDTACKHWLRDPWMLLKYASFFWDLQLEGPLSPMSKAFLLDCSGWWVEIFSLRDLSWFELAHTFLFFQMVERHQLQQSPLLASFPNVCGFDRESWR